MRCLSGCAAMLILLFAAVPDARAVDKAAIDKAVERGVAALRAMQTKTGTWEGNGPEYEGFTALVAITLYECEVPFTDPALRKAVEAVRSSATRSNSVYAISLAIILLDLLQDDVDEPLIESLSLRLVTSQTNLGGWGYKTGAVPEAEWKRLEAHYEKAKGQRHKESKPGRTLQDLSPEIQKQLAQFATSGTQIDDTKITSDNSNTQFATLALWVSRRHGFPVDTALALIDLRYRKSRNLDGGWGYWPTADREIKQGVTKPATTCSAILGLSVGHGVVLATRKGLGPDARMLPDPSRDLDLRAGLTYLATKIGDPPSLRKTPVPQLGRTDYYFLWSLERVLLALDMQTLGGKDWYAWGTELLLANQQADGHWIGEHASGADTCFALLFLRRANLAADLTAQMKKSSVVLTAGGAREKEPKPPAETGTKKPPSESTPTKEPTKTTVPKPEPRPTFSKPESARLAEELVKATSARQGELLGEWRQAKGVHYTEALAGAIPQLTGDSKRQARETLATRLTAMTADTIARYLKDDDVEIRRAAALASGTREFKDQLPRLIDMLSDRDQGVVLAAHAALKAMTGQTFGPSPEPWRVWMKQR